MPKQKQPDALIVGRIFQTEDEQNQIDITQYVVNDERLHNEWYEAVKIYLTNALIRTTNESDVYFLARLQVDTTNETPVFHLEDVQYMGWEHDKSITIQS